MSYRPVATPPPSGLQMMRFTQPTAGKAAAAPAPPANPCGTDALLLQFEGSLADSSPFARTATNVGGATISSTRSKFGTSSLLLSGSGQYLTFPATELWTPPGGLDFTFETFIYPTSLGTTRTIAGTRAANRGWLLLLSATGMLTVVGWDSTGTVTVNMAASSATAANAWGHAVVSRKSGVWYLLQNGTLIGSQTPTAQPANTGQLLSIGRDGDVAGREFAGNVDSLRFRVGAALYTGAYTVPTSAFTSTQCTTA